MSRRRQTLFRYVIYVLLGVVVFLLAYAVATPAVSAKRNLFAAALLGAVALLLVCILLGSAQLEAARFEAATADTKAEASRAETASVHRQLLAHVAACDAEREARDVDVQLRRLIQQAPRSA